MKSLKTDTKSFIVFLWYGDLMVSVPEQGVTKERMEVIVSVLGALHLFFSFVRLDVSVKGTSFAIRNIRIKIAAS